MTLPVTIVFSLNDKHTPLLGAALCSLFENKMSDYPITIVVLDGGISVVNKERLSVLEERYLFSIKYIIPSARLFENISTGYYPIASYYRIAIASLLSMEYKKVIYLDCDVLVRGDIRELFSMDLEEKIIAAVPDRNQNIQRGYLEELCGKRGRYFNSGVLIINLDSWRRYDVERRLFSFIYENQGKLIFPDQDALNVILFDAWKELDMKYNFMSVYHNSLHLDDSFIVHFAGENKPWYFFSDIPYHKDWLFYINKTPWSTNLQIMDQRFANKHRIFHRVISRLGLNEHLMKVIVSLLP
jgi:lipopolysaccharide biosynthesis glycosyltransferase